VDPRRIVKAPLKELRYALGECGWSGNVGEVELERKVFNEDNNETIMPLQQTPHCHSSIESRYMGFSRTAAISSKKDHDRSSHQISDKRASGLVVARWPILQVTSSSDHKRMSSDVL
jgi:hypothetical protein